MTLDILRDGQSRIVPLAMAERDGPLGGLSASIDPRQNLVPRLGILGVDLDARLAGILPGARVRSGVVVVSTVAGAIDARDGGLRPATSSPGSTAKTSPDWPSCVRRWTD